MGFLANRHDMKTDRKTVYLKDNSGLLQQIGPHVCSDDVPLAAKANLDVLPKSTAVVIPGGFSIPNGLCE